MRATSIKRRVRDSYFDLVRAFPLRPIHSERDLERGIEVLKELSLARPEDEMDAGERDYVEALSLLVERFESRRRETALPRLTPVDRLKFLMDERRMNVSDLGRVIGSQPNASLILHGKRSMSKSQIVKLGRYFEVSAALFIQ